MAYTAVHHGVLAWHIQLVCTGVASWRMDSTPGDMVAYIHVAGMEYTPVQGTTAVALYAGHTRLWDTLCLTHAYTQVWTDSQDAPVR